MPRSVTLETNKYLLPKRQFQQMALLKIRTNGHSSKDTATTIKEDFRAKARKVNSLSYTSYYIKL